MVPLVLIKSLLSRGCETQNAAQMVKTGLMPYRGEILKMERRVLSKKKYQEKAHGLAIQSSFFFFDMNMNRG